MTEPAEEQSHTNVAPKLPVAVRYGLLVLILGLLARNLWTLAQLPRPYTTEPFGNLVVALMLLFNHIAFMFRWRRRLRVALWVLAFGWLAFGCFYIFYLEHRLFP